MHREPFGTTADGERVERATLEGGGLTASVIGWGAALQDLRLAGHAPPLVLGFDRFEDYPVHSRHFGASAGRIANRIAGGRFTLDGRVIQGETNFLGRHMLHGGARGTSKRVWRFTEVTGERAALTLTDPDGQGGLPGNVVLSAIYELPGEGVLRITYRATTDAPTLVGLAHHSYFNLDGGDSVLDHKLRIDADAYLPVDAELIPTGEVRPVEGTPFDFRTLRPIRHVEAGPDGAPRQSLFDHNWCLARQRRPLTSVAEAVSPASGVRLGVATTEPGLQVFTAPTLSVPVPGLEGRRYGPYAGFCLETQVWPDSPNHARFPQAVLRPGEVLEQVTEYRFTRG